MNLFAVAGAKVAPYWLCKRFFKLFFDYFAMNWFLEGWFLMFMREY